MTNANDSFFVRSARLADEAAVSALLGASYPILMKSSYDERALQPALELMIRAQPALLESGTYYVAVSSGGTIVGCGGWTRERPGDHVIQHGVGHIRHFGTHPGWARRGVGRAIYSRCETDAREAGVIEMECYSSLNAEAFYAAIGFEKIGRLEMPMAEGVVLPSVHMRRRI